MLLNELEYFMKLIDMSKDVILLGMYTPLKK